MGKLTDDILKWTLDVNGDPARKQLTEVSNATNKLEKSNRSLETEMAKLEAHGKKGGEEWKKYEAQIKANSTTIDANKKRMEQLRKEVGLTNLSATELRKEMGNLKRQMDRMDPNTKAWKDMNSQYTAMSGRLGQIRGGVGAVNGVFGVFKGLLPALGVGALVGGLKSLFTNIVSVRKEFEKYEAVLTNTLGSNKAARQEMQMLQDFASETPFALTELTGAFVKLTNYGLKPSKEEMRKYGDIAASVGKGFDQFAEAMADAVTGEFERLKEFGIKAKKEGDKISFTFKEQTTVVDNNATSIKNYISGLGDLQGVSGSMAAIAGTLGGKISNMGDAWDGLMNTLGSGTSGVMIDVIGWMTSFVGTLDSAFKSISQIKDAARAKATSSGIEGGIGEVDFTAKSLMKKGVKDAAAYDRALKLYMDSTKETWNTYRKQMEGMQGPEKEALKRRMNDLLEERKGVEAHYKKMTEIKNKELSKTQGSVNSDKSKSSKPAPRAIDFLAVEADKPIDEAWVKSQVDADTLVFAEKKRTQEEWSAFLEKKVQENIDIKNKELDNDKAITEAQQELKSVRMDAISQIAGSLSDMFEQGSAAQIAFMAIEKAAAIAQIIFQTSIANAKAVAASPLTFGQPWVAINTISAGVSIAGIVSQTIGSLKNNKKGKKDGGYSGNGSDDEVDGFYHKNEFIASAPAVRNPTVKPVLDIIDMAQRSGTIKTLNLSAIVPGRQSGGYGSSVANSGSNSYTNQNSGIYMPNEDLKELRTAIKEFMKHRPRVALDQVQKGLDNLKEVNSNRGL
ncbi:MAG: hypothetical protein JZU49_00045 [Sulfuricurvum sp.]|nr:hypothetical protein [Sulfuricurvum sp.]